MALREILTYPRYKPELRRKSDPVSRINQPVKQLIRDLKDTLQASSDGIGLAAPQINKIEEARDERKDFDGCLSFPGLYGETVRPHYLRVTALDQAGQPFEQVFEGFNAVIVHHEIDHLDGILFIDRVERFEDLYQLFTDENGQRVRVQLSSDVTP
jgi:peptide deformylase